MIRKILQGFICSMSGKRCVFCDKEVCAMYPSGNPFIGTEYRAALEKAGRLKK